MTSSAGPSHATIVVERRLRTDPARVFGAWADPTQRVKWDVPGDDWIVAEFEQDFRVDGRETSRFGPPDGPKYRTAGRYLNIVPDQRIVLAGVMHDGDVPTSCTMTTLLLRPDGAGTHLTLIDQSVYLGEGETSDLRRGGWAAILDKLEAWLAVPH